MSDFIIYDANRVRIGLLQHEESVQWLERYQAPGEVKIEAQATPDNLAMLVDGNRIYNAETGTAARISQVEIAQTEFGRQITARGSTTSELLGDRVVMATEPVTNIEAAMYLVFSKNRRELPIAVGSARGYTERSDMEITWGSVLEAEQKLAEISGLGFMVEFEPEAGAETFTVYKGVDRTDDESGDYVGYFGTDVGNIENISFASGTAGFKNVAIVAGAGEGADRAVRIVSLGSVSGEQRRELYVDARDLQQEYQVATPTGDYDENGNPTYDYESRTYTDAEYNAMLDARGMEKLAECLQTFSITCDVAQNNILYGIDYSLGDRMPVKIPEYGIYASARVSAVTMVHEKEGNKITVSLSEFEIGGP